jgi:transposase
MARIKTWEISDEFWNLAEPLIPKDLRNPNKVYKRKPGGGRKPKYSNRVFFAAIVYVLRTGIIWNALPREKFEGVGSAMVHRKFQQWAVAGFFGKLWRKGLAEYDEMEGIAWLWQSADGSNLKAPLAQESVGPSPTDRGKKRKQAKPSRRRQWGPLVTRRHRRQSA